jgi:uncharacterized membrane protein (UPF0182 family)
MYLRAQAGRIPELTRVIVAYQNSIVMDRTLDAALARLFSPEAVAARRAQPKDTAYVPLDAPVPVAAAPAAGPSPAPATPGATVVPAPQSAALGALTPAQLTAEAQATYQRAITAQRAGDWATYGTEITRLGQILEQLAAPR